MEKTILDLLTKKFSAARKDVLGVLAGTLAIQNTTDEDATKVVEAITAEQIEAFSKRFRSGVDKEVSEAVAKVKAKASSKTEAPTNEEESKTNDSNLALIEQIKQLQAKVDGLQTQNTRTAYKARFDAAIGELGKTHKGLLNEVFESKNFNTEEEFNQFLEHAKSVANEARSEAQNSALKGHSAPYRSTGSDGVSNAVKAYLERSTEQSKVDGVKLKM